MFHQNEMQICSVRLLILLGFLFSKQEGKPKTILKKMYWKHVFRVLINHFVWSSYDELNNELLIRMTEELRHNLLALPYGSVPTWPMPILKVTSSSFASLKPPPSNNTHQQWSLTLCWFSTIIRSESHLITWHRLTNSFAIDHLSLKHE